MQRKYYLIIKCLDLIQDPKADIANLQTLDIVIHVNP